jgi:enoyl-CoA hydratase
MGITTRRDGPIALVTIDHPPVNALPVAGWFELADALRNAGEDPTTHVVVLRAEGRGFCAGVDIKELQRSAEQQSHQALVGVNRGCAAAFGAVYDCAVPVVAAVHGFCLGGGIGLVGNADVVLAASDATFGLPEVDRGALGAATHLSRLVPQHLLRALYFTARTITADELYRHGSVLEVLPREELDAAALAVAAEIAAKDTRVIRAAKEALNGIDPQPVRRSYRFEQGFTYEMTLLGAGDEARTRFVNGATPDPADGPPPVAPDPADGPPPGPVAGPAVAGAVPVPSETTGGER